VKRFGEYKKGYDLCSPKREGEIGIGGKRVSSFSQMD
jgi:hypothetical protein